jgi:hypothetical protein
MVRDPVSTESAEMAPDEGARGEAVSLKIGRVGVDRNEHLQFRKCHTRIIVKGSPK